MHKAPGQKEALENLGAEIRQRWPNAVELGKDFLSKRLPNRRALIAGWRLPGVLPFEPHDLIVALDREYPWGLPIVALPDAVGGISYPHVEPDGYLCVTPASSAFRLPVCADHVEFLIKEATIVLEQGRTRANDDDFYDEAHSYWSLTQRANGSIWLTAPPPEAHGVWVSGTLGDDFVIAPTKQELVDWSKASGRKLFGTVEPSIMVRLEEPLHPKDYPLTMKDLAEFLERIGASSELRLALSKWHARRELPVVLTFDYKGKETSLGAVFQAPRQVKMPGARHTGIPGFRHSHKSRSGGRLRALAQVPARFPHLRVTPIYRSFLHIRTAGAPASPLATRHVVIAGCGAIGGQLAVQLAQAGVGQLTLLDNDSLTWQNVGRHVLDSSVVGQSKAVALAAAIRRRFPDARVEGVPKSWQDYVADGGDALESADLMIAVTGDASSNLLLDAYVGEGDAPATIFGWLEPFSVAAHAIFSHPGSRALGAVTDDFGRLIEPVADFPSAPPLPREPSCGAFYQPYSSLGALPGIALIGEMALDALHGRLANSSHRVWVGGHDEFARNDLSLHTGWTQRLVSLGYNRRFDFVIQPG